MGAKMTVLFSMLLLNEPALAERFRCGQSLVSAENTVAELLEKCGAPTSKSVEVIDVYGATAAGGRIKRGTSTVETWTYDRGSQSFPMIVTIVDGKIKSMERGELTGS